MIKLGFNGKGKPGAIVYGMGFISGGLVPLVKTNLLKLWEREGALRGVAASRFYDSDIFTYM